MKMEATDALAIRQVLSGDSDSFRLLVERHSRRIHGVAWRITGNSGDADDVVQETFLRAYRMLDSYSHEASFGTWLHRIAVNCALDLVKSRKRRESRHLETEDGQMIDAVASDGPDQDRLIQSWEVNEAVRRALETLSENERTALILRHFEGMSLEEIGESLGTKLSATKNTIFRAVRKLRKELEPLTGQTS